MENLKEIYQFQVKQHEEEKIGSCFDVHVNFSYPQNVSEFDYLIENFQRNKKTDGYDKDDNVIGESNKFDRLIVMDNVSGNVLINQIILLVF